MSAFAHDRRDPPQSPHHITQMNCDRTASNPKPPHPSLAHPRAHLRTDGEGEAVVEGDAEPVGEEHGEEEAVMPEHEKRVDAVLIGAAVTARD